MTTAHRALSLIAAALIATAAACGSSAESGSGDHDGTSATGSQAGPAGDGGGSEESAESGDLDAGRPGPLLDVGDGSDLGVQICAILTADEIGALLGRPVGEGQVSGPLSSACTWDLPGNGSVMVQVVPPDYWSSVETEGDPEYQEVTGLGDDAFVQPSMFGGWTAAARYADRMVLVDIGGSSTTADLTVHVLEGVVAQLNP